MSSTPAPTLPWSEKEKSSMKWEEFSQSMSTGRQGLAAAASGNKFLVFGGNNGSYLSASEMLDLQTGNWTVLPSMPTARYYSAAVVVGNQAFVLGGHDGNDLNAVEMLDVDKQKWTVCHSMSTPRQGCAAVAVGNRIVVVGGYNKGNLKTAEMYNLDTKNWSALPPMETARGFCSAAVVEGKVFIFGGDGAEKTAEMFNTVTQQWTTLPPIPFHHTRGAAVAIGKYIVLVSGSVNRTDMFDTESQTWFTALPSMNTKRSWCAAALIRNQIIVAGGYFSCNKLDTAERLVLPDVPSRIPLPPEIPPLPFVLGKHQRATALQGWLGTAVATKKEYLEKVDVAKQNIATSFKIKLDRLEEQLQALLWKKDTTSEEQQKLLESLQNEADGWVAVLDDQIVDAEELLGELLAVLNPLPAKSPAAHEEHVKKEDVAPPSHLVCPITRQVMEYPVVASDGHTYERSAIEQHIGQVPEGQDVLSPVTGVALPIRNVFPNISTQNLIRSYHEQQKK